LNSQIDNDRNSTGRAKIVFEYDKFSVGFGGKIRFFGSQTQLIVPELS